MIKEYLNHLVQEKEPRLFQRVQLSFLWLLSVFYRVIVWSLRGAYQLKIITAKKLPVPVISVGNITLGGAGKTPFVFLLAKYFFQKGYQPVILTRGYMDKSFKPSHGKSAVSDEARQLEDTLKDVPVLTGADRYQSAREYLNNHKADVFILDDGFQHWKLHRDLDIVLLDSTRPFGNGELLPRGFLRESISSLRVADEIILTKVDSSRSQLDLISRRLGDLKIRNGVIQSVHRPTAWLDEGSQENFPLDYLDGKDAIMLTSIADPASFEEMLKRLNIFLKESFCFMDHYVYNRTDFLDIIQSCQTNQTQIIVTTQKDIVKLRQFLGDKPQDINIYSLIISLELLGRKESLYDRIDSVVFR